MRPSFGEKTKTVIILPTRPTKVILNNPRLNLREQDPECHKSWFGPSLHQPLVYTVFIVVIILVAGAW